MLSDGFETKGFLVSDSSPDKRGYRTSLTTPTLSNVFGTNFSAHSEERFLSSDFLGPVSMTTARL